MMRCLFFKDILKPSRTTILITLALMVLSYLFFTTTNIRVFPCEVRLVIPYPVKPSKEVCGLNPAIVGIDRSYSFFGYLVMILLLFLVPYLMAYILTHKINKIGRR